MTKKFHAINKFNYKVASLIFNVLSIPIICFIYYQGYLGEVTEDFIKILSDFVYDPHLNPSNLFYPVSILLIVVSIGLFVSYFYKAHFTNIDIEEMISIELIEYSLIFIPIIIGLTIVEFYIALNSNGSAWFIAFLLIFSNMFLFNYLYVLKLYKYIDNKFDHS